MLDDQDAAAPLSGRGGVGGRKGRKTKRRGGELYDAFAGGSDEELFSEDEREEVYRDVDDDGAREKASGGVSGDGEKRSPGGTYLGPEK